MSISPIASRSTLLMSSENLLRSLQKSQYELYRVQEHINTGRTVLRPSEGANKASTLLFLQQSIAARAQQLQNLQHASGMLDNVDAALNDTTDILLEAQQLAADQVGVGSDDETRAATAQIVDSQVQALLTIANRQYNNISLFGGNGGAAKNGAVFSEFLGGIRYTGSTTNLEADTGGVSTQPFTSNGLDAFGALSARVRSVRDLDPQATATTALKDIDGFNGYGFRGGPVQVTVNGASTNVDLGTADTLGDVVTRLNDAIAAIDPTAGGVALAASGFDLTANAGHNISIADISGGKAASDLGLPAGASSATVAGSDINLRVTERTRLADLGLAIDFASGLQITQGTTTKTADFSAAVTVQDMQNVIRDLDLGLRLEIGQGGRTLDLVSEVSGIELAVGENGGTTAADLGLATLGADTELAAFRHGLGVEPKPGDDFRITLHDGTQINVDLDENVRTVADLMAAIQTAADAVTALPGDLTVSLASVGTGITFTDNTAGGGAFRIQNLGQSLVADQLGLTADAGAGASITSVDQSRVRVDSVFTHLMNLSESLRKSDTLGITLAGEAVDNDLDRVASARAQVGVEAARAEQTVQRTKDMELADKTMLSELQDTDMAEAITRLAQLQTQLQASMQVGSIVNQTSLLDFLR